MSDKDEDKTSAERLKEFLNVVNERRPYCGKDFVPQTWLRDLSKLR